MQPAATPLPSLEELMTRLRGLVVRGAALLEARLDMPTSQLVVLEAIAEGARGVSDVARATVTHVSSASRTIDAMVRDGLVDRSTDPQDRRAVVLALTPHGRARRDDMNSHRDTIVAEALAGLEPAERARLVALLGEFLTGFETAIARAEADLADRAD